MTSVQAGSNLELDKRVVLEGLLLHLLSLRGRCYSPLPLSFDWFLDSSIKWNPVHCSFFLYRSSVRVELRVMIVSLNIGFIILEDYYQCFEYTSWDTCASSNLGVLLGTNITLQSISNEILRARASLQ